MSIDEKLAQADVYLYDEFDVTDPDDIDRLAEFLLTYNVIAITTCGLILTCKVRIK